MLRKFFRHPATDVYMMFAYFISLMAMLFVLSLLEEIHRAERDKETYQYDSTYTFLLEGADIERCVETIGEQRGNIYLQSVIGLDDKGISTEVFVVLAETEEWLYPLLAGRYPTKEEIALGKPVVVIGKGYADFLNAGVDDTIRIDGESYQVVGIIGSKTSEVLYAMFFLWFSGCSGITKEQLLQKNDYEITICSNEEAAENSYLRLREELNKIMPQVKLTGQSGTASQGTGNRYLELWLYLALYVMAVLHCIVAAELWVHVRRREIAICKAHGFSFSGIFFRLFQESVRLSLAVAAVCVVLQGILQMHGGALFGVELTLSWQNRAFFLALTMLTTVLAIYRPAKQAEKSLFAANYARERSRE